MALDSNNSYLHWKPKNEPASPSFILLVSPIICAGVFIRSFAQLLENLPRSLKDVGEKLARGDSRLDSFGRKIVGKIKPSELLGFVVVVGIFLLPSLNLCELFGVQSGSVVIAKLAMDPNLFTTNIHIADGLDGLDDHISATNVWVRGSMPAAAFEYI